MSYLLIGLLTCFTALLGLDLYSRSSWFRSPHRGSGGRSIARVGGVAIAVAVGIAGVLAVYLPVGASRIPAAGLLPALAGALLVFLIGWVDDMKSLPPVVKLGGQVLAASASWLLGLKIGFLPDGGANYLFTVFCLVGGANAVNLVDGLDGLAGGMGLLAGGTLFFIARNAGQIDAAVLAVALTGACLAFLWFNLPPARVFMGDSGSNFLGFGLVAVAILLSGGAEGFGNFSSGILLLAVPIVETATSIGRRLIRGRSPFTGDLNHIHHRLLRQGWSLGAILALFHGTTLLLSILVLFGDELAALPVDRGVVAWTTLGGLLLVSSIFILTHARMSRAPEIDDETT